MEILEDFIIDLICRKKIQNYTAKLNTIQAFFNSAYKEKANCSFEDFLLHLWYYWYVNRYSKRYIYFDQRWVNYLSKTERAKEAEHPFSEANYVDTQYCSLCGDKFASTEQRTVHLEKTEHKIRLQYVKDKSAFDCTENILSTQMTSSDGTADDAVQIYTQQNVVTLRTEARQRVETTLVLKNKSGRPLHIKKVVQVNPFLNGVKTNVNHIPEGSINNSRSIIVTFKLNFHYSSNFSLPIVVVTNSGNIMKNIIFEVTSEYSDLMPEGVSYTRESVKPDNSNVLEEEEIIPGKRPDPYSSSYVETLPLLPFKISKQGENQLRRVVEKYPSFIERSVANNVFFKDFARMLNVDPPIKQDNHCHLLMKILDVEENQMKIDIRNYNMHTTMELVPHAFKNGSHLFKLEVPGLAEARPSLLPYDSVYVKIAKGDNVKYQGIVHKVRETAVHLGFNYRFEQSFIAKKKYFIEFGFNRRPIRVEKQAIALANKHKIIPYFFPTCEEMESMVPEKLHYFNNTLNHEQKIAVENIMNHDLKAPYLIFGPPGTGKTVTVVEAILQLWKTQPSSKILVCAPSNAATNEIASRLITVMPTTDIFRFVGNIYGHDNKVAKLSKIVNIDQDGNFYMPSMDQLLGYRVLLTTLVTAARLVNGGAPKDHFTHVFIDEGGYATESQTLIPIAGILSHGDRNGHIKGNVILAGDPRQLGPLVHSQFARHCGYGKSMLERLLDSCEPYARHENLENNYDQRYVTKLLKNYRSHKTILTIPNQLFYHNELIANGNDMSDVFTNWEHLKTPGFPMIFHHVEGVDVREETSPSFFNVQEIEQVMEYVSKLVDSRVSGMRITQGHLGIITPYRKQVEKLNKALDKKNMKNILVGSVEQFQGKEKLVIIISTVRSKNFNLYEKIDQKCQLGFLRNPKRFNVALTRAKALLVVVGNGKVLQDDPNWSSFVRYCGQQVDCRKTILATRFAK